MSEHTILLDAARRAVAAHGDQRYGDRPYIAHLLEVAALVDHYRGTPAQVVAAVLHDVVEDTGESIDSVRTRFGPEVAAIVGAVTKLDGETADQYLARICSVPGAALVKFCDSRCNLDGLASAAMDEARRAKLTARYTHNLSVLWGAILAEAQS